MLFILKVEILPLADYNLLREVLGSESSRMAERSSYSLAFELAGLQSCLLVRGLLDIQQGSYDLAAGWYSVRVRWLAELSGCPNG